MTYTFPFKPGDNLFYAVILSDGQPSITPITVSEIVIKEKETFIVDEKENRMISLKEFGKSIFSSHEEAEESLKEKVFASFCIHL